MPAFSKAKKHNTAFLNLSCVVRVVTGNHYSITTWRVSPAKESDSAVYFQWLKEAGQKG